jgi:hypothetical protein
VRGGANEAVTTPLTNVDYSCRQAYDLIGFESVTFMPMIVTSTRNGRTTHFREQTQAEAWCEGIEQMISVTNATWIPWAY